MTDEEFAAERDAAERAIKARRCVVCGTATSGMGVNCSAWCASVYVFGEPGRFGDSLGDGRQLELFGE